jgi:hypothetical protein
VGAAWEAPRVVADAGERPLATCFVGNHTRVTCRPLYGVAAPRLFLTPSGAGVALWNRWDGTRFRLVSSRLGADGLWDAPDDLPPGAGVGDLEDQDNANYGVTGDAQGHALAFWVAGGTLYTTRQTAARGWDPPETVARGVFGVKMATLDTEAGGFLVWGHSGGFSWSRHTAEGWSAPGPVARFLGYGTVAPWGDGRALAAWTNEGEGARIAGFTPEGGWSAPASPTLEAGLDAALAASPAGAVITRPRRTAQDTRLLGQGCATFEACAAGSWTTPVLVSADDDGERFVSLHALAGNTRGDAVAVWLARSPTVSGYRVGARQYTAASRTWGNAALIVRTDRQLYDLRVALSDAGNAVAVWRDIDRSAGLTSLWVSHLVPAGGWSAPQRLHTGPAAAPDEGIESVTAAALVMDARGRAVVAWAERAGTRAAVWSARLEPQTR